MINSDEELNQALDRLECRLHSPTDVEQLQEKEAFELLRARYKDYEEGRFLSIKQVISLNERANGNVNIKNYLHINTLVCKIKNIINSNDNYDELKSDLEKYLSDLIKGSLNL